MDKDIVKRPRGVSKKSGVGRRELGPESGARSSLHVPGGGFSALGVDIV